MNLIVISTLLALCHSLAEYTTFHFKDQMKVESFAFSENENIMVVLQDNTFSSNGICENLPHLIYKKTSNGFELMGKESYEKFQSIQQSYFRTVKNIQMNRQGTIFISGHNDNIVRVFQINGSFIHQIQDIYHNATIPGSFSSTYIPFLREVRMSPDGGMLQVNHKIYKWASPQFKQFAFFQDANDFPSLTFCGEYAFTWTSLLNVRQVQKKLRIYKHSGKVLETLRTLDVPVGFNQPANDANIYVSSQDKKKFTILAPTYITNGTKIQRQIAIFEVELPFDYLTFKQSIPISSTYVSSIYLTQNERYFGFSPAEGQSVLLYEKKQGEYQLINKFWNFTKGISDIYISEDAGLVVVANKYTPRSNDPKFSKDQQITFFYKCFVANCAKCTWSGACTQCKDSYIRNNNECKDTNLDRQFDRRYNDEIILEGGDKQSSSNRDIYAKLDIYILVLALFLALTLVVVYFILVCAKKICQKCGITFVLFDFRKKKLIALNEQVRSNITDSNIESRGGSKERQEQ